MKTLFMTICLLFGLTAAAESSGSSFLNPNQLSNSVDPNLSRNAFEGAGILSDPTDCPKCLAAQNSRNNLTKRLLPPSSQGIVVPGAVNRTIKPGSTNDNGVNTGQ